MPIRLYIIGVAVVGASLKLDILTTQSCVQYKSVYTVCSRYLLISAWFIQSNLMNTLCSVALPVLSY